MQNKEMLFQKAKCRGYLKKVHDGRFIAMDSAGNCTYVDNSITENGEPWSCPVPEEDYDGSEHFLKTYYQYKEQNFSGVVTGIKDVIITAYLTIDTNYDYRGCEYVAIQRVPDNVLTCAVVFYANNLSHLVPVEKLEIIDSEDLENTERRG